LAKALEHLENYYWSPGGPAGKTKEDVRRASEASWRQGLELFYRDYAFERAGAPRTWGAIAQEIISQFPSNTPTNALPSWAWSRFVKQIAPGSPNKKNNPLWTDGPKIPATQFIASLDTHHHNLFAWAVAELRTGAGWSTYQKLQTLQGIGPKIAAFFLRDVLVSHEIPEGSLDDLACIVPVDVWVRRGVSVLLGLSKPPTEASDHKTQKVAVELADRLAIRSATLDVGLWVLGARFARTPTQLERALTRPDELQRLVVSELERALAAAHALEEIAKPIAALTPDASDSRDSAPPTD
jgi:hypothetical protein